MHNSEIHIGENLRKAIKDKGLKYSHFAKTAGISLSHLNKILSGEKNPSIEVVRNLSRALEIKEAVLIGEQESSKREQRIGDLTKTEFAEFYSSLRYVSRLSEIVSKLERKDLKKVIQFAEELEKKSILERSK